MIAEFQLPSNPKVTVKLREATVAEAIDFSAVDPRAEETATTFFLNTVQEEPAVDAGLWTGEDRRFALFQYHLNTTQERTMPVTFTCPRCGGTHTVDVSLSQIMAGYRPMQGEPFREVVLDGHNVRVMPPNGRGLELLERYRFDLEATQNMPVSNLSPSQALERENEIRKKIVRNKFLRLLISIDVPSFQGSTPEERRPQVEELIKRLPAGMFQDFVTSVGDALADMRHGLATEWDDGELLMVFSGVHCPDEPTGEPFPLRFQFRAFSFIPTV